jgi:hypothetical protein
LGLAIAFNVDVIVPWLERTFGFQIMPASIYYVNELPSEVHLFDVVVIPLLALVIAAAATIYPARRAAAIAPAVALRYDKTRVDAPALSTGGCLALPARAQPQRFYLVHLGRFDRRHRARRCGIDSRALGHERLRV